MVEKKVCFTLAFPYFPIWVPIGSNACGCGSAATAAAKNSSRSSEYAMYIFLKFQKGACYTYFWNLIFSKKTKKQFKTKNSTPPIESLLKSKHHGPAQSKKMKDGVALWLH